MPALEALCFDLDTTLCVAEQDDEDVHAAVFDRVDVDPYFSPGDVRAVDPADLPTAHSDREYYENLYRAVADHVGTEPTRVEDLAAATVEVVDETAVTWRAGAPDALEYARERYDVGLITNGGEDTQRPKLERLGIAGAFDATVFCDPVAGVEPKPDPAPFRQALSTLDAAPERSVYVGNSLRGDVAGANGVGMQSVWIPRDGAAEVGAADPEPTHRIDSMTELPSLL